MNDHIAFFDKGVVQVAAVHACVGGGTDRSGRRRQTLDL